MERTRPSSQIKSLSSQQEKRNHQESHGVGWCLVPSSEWMFWAPLFSVRSAPCDSWHRNIPSLHFSLRVASLHFRLRVVSLHFLPPRTKKDENTAPGPSNARAWPGAASSPRAGEPVVERRWNARGNESRCWRSKTGLRGCALLVFLEHAGLVNRPFWYVMNQYTPYILLALKSLDKVSWPYRNGGQSFTPGHRIDMPGQVVWVSESMVETNGPVWMLPDASMTERQCEA